IHLCLIQGNVGIPTSRLSYFGRDCRISADAFAFNKLGSRQDLRAVAYSGDRLPFEGKVTNHVKNLGIQTQIFRSPTSWNKTSVIFAHIHVIEAGVQREIVTPLFAVSLIAF